MTHYTTGELAKLCDVTVRTVQFYDSKDLLKPTDLTDGGRRLYTDEDLQRLRVICFLKDLGFSLQDIAELFGASDMNGILELLIDNQSKTISQNIEEGRARLNRIEELRKNLGFFANIDTESIGVMADIVEDKKKLRAARAKLLVIGLIMDLLWLPALIYGILSGVWWPFAIGMLAAVVLGVAISSYYMHRVAYVCPEDHTVFRPPARKLLFARHTPSLRMLTCPTCGQKRCCLEIYAPPEKPKDMDGTLIWSKDGESR